MKRGVRSIVGFCWFALFAFGWGCDGQAEAPVHYQRFVLVEVEQPKGGCANLDMPVTPCATVVLALDTKTGQVCRAAALHGLNYPLCLRLYESYPDNKAEVERLKAQIEADKSSDWDTHSGNIPSCPSSDPLGLFTPKPCKPLPPKNAEQR